MRHLQTQKSNYSSTPFSLGQSGRESVSFSCGPSFLLPRGPLRSTVTDGLRDSGAGVSSIRNF